MSGIRRKAVPFTITPCDFFDDVNRVRALFARLVHTPHPENIAMVPSVSYGMAVVARNTPLSPKSSVVTVHHQFPSNVYPWRRLCADAGATLEVVRPPDGAQRRAESWNQAILEAIDSRTALVAVPQIHWTDGTIFDVSAIGTRAREVGAAFVIDGTQSVGAMELDVSDVNPDALVCAAYKWLLGPYATGCAFFGPRFRDGIPIEETWIGREGSEDFSGLVDYQDRYREGAIRFDVGENSNFSLMPMVIAALEQILEWGVAPINHYCGQLTAPLAAAAQEKGYAVAEESGRARHMFGIRVPSGLDLQELRARLAERQVFVSVRGDAIRIAPHVYNDSEDVAALIDLL